MRVKTVNTLTRGEDRRQRSGRKCLWSRYGLGHAWFPKCYLERHMEANVQSERYINSSNLFTVDIVE
jgi:hypothetical protein